MASDDRREGNIIATVESHSGDGEEEEVGGIDDGGAAAGEGERRWRSSL